MQIYHNPRCRKSREALQLLESKNIAHEVVLYLDNVPTVEELKTILKKLGIAPVNLIRTQEAIWKQNYKGKKLSNDDILQAMAQHPKLIERPIIIKGENAVIGRPAEKILTLL